MKILLCMLSNEQAGMMGFIERHQLRPPMGILLLTALLREAGHEVDVFDQRVERISCDAWIERIQRGRYDLVGVTCFSTSRVHHASYLAALRERWSGLIAVGGPGVQMRSVDFWLDHGADLAVPGEGERTLVEYVARKQAGQPVAGLPGSVVRERDGRTVIGPPRDSLTVAELEALPHPAYTREWIEAWTDRTIINAPLPSAGVITARGCPYSCAFCGSPGKWPGLRQRSVANVTAEIDWLVESFQVKHLCFLDDIWGMRPEWALEFCDELMKRPYRLKWMCILHPLTFGKRRSEVLRKMAAAGLNFVSFGAQSADPTVLKNINRNPREIDALRENVPLLRSLGVATALTYIFGLPGDSPATVDKAIEFVREVKPTVADFHPLWYFEGTELGEKYPNCDATSYSYEDHKAWSQKARRSFYLDPGVVYRFASYVLRTNPRYVVELTKLMLDAFPAYVFESARAKAGESGDERTLAVQPPATRGRVRPGPVID